MSWIHTHCNLKTKSGITIANAGDFSQKNDISHCQHQRYTTESFCDNNETTTVYNGFAIWYKLRTKVHVCIVVDYVTKQRTQKQNGAVNVVIKDTANGRAQHQLLCSVADFVNMQ